MFKKNRFEGTAASASRLASVLLLIACLTGTAFAKTKSSSYHRVPVGTQMKIRLNDTVDSKHSQSGDRFTATVLTPRRYEESTIEGHLSSVKQSGKFKGRTSLVFSFDRIRYASGGSAPLRGQVVRVYEDSVSKVDDEGHVESGKRGTQTVKRTGIGAAAGAVIGGLAGGGKGAAIGAAVGGGAGAASVMIQGSKRLKLEPGTEMLIKVTR
jgi:hypothetical protein